MGRTKENNLQTRLKDVKEEYNTNEILINKLIADLKKFEHLFMENTNGTYSAIPSLKIYQDLQNTNIKLRKQINEMELIQQKGTLLDTEDDYSPFC